MKKENTKSLIRGGQLWLYNTRMLAQVVGRITKWAILAYLALVALLMFIVVPPDAWKLLSMQVYAYIVDWIGMGSVHVWTNQQNPSSFITAHYWLNSPEQNLVADAFSHALKSLIFSLVVGFGLYLLVTKLLTRLFVKTGNKYATDHIISGTRLAKSVKETIASVQKSGAGASNIKIGNTLPMPRFSVWQGIMYHGSIGSGKTQGIMRLLDEIKQAGDPCIIYDKECALKPYFFEAGVDKELNPLSADCVNWDIWSECENPIELAALATYLMPKSVQGSDPFWVDAARVIFTSTAWEMRAQEDKTPIKLLQNLLTTQLDELRKILKHTEAENLVSKDIEKTAISIRAVMATYTKSLRFLEGLEKDKNNAPFAIKEWVKAQADSTAPRKSWLWVTSRAKFHAEIKPLLSAWLGMAMKGIQSLDHHKNKNKRFWIIIDEKASLNRLEDFSDIAADIRKFGGCIVLGLHSNSQLQFIYGRDEGAAIADLMNTSIYFRSPKEAVAEWVSKDLGEQLVEEVRETQSYGPDPIRDGNSVGMQRVTRRTVEASTIMQLDDLVSYVRLAGNHPITRLALPYVEDRPLKTDEALVERKIDWNAIKKIADAANALENNPDIDDGVKEEQASNVRNAVIAEHPELADSPKKLAAFIAHNNVTEAILAQEAKNPVVIEQGEEKVCL